MLGAVMATSVTLVGWNRVLYLASVDILGINPTIFSLSPFFKTIKP